MDSFIAENDLPHSTSTTSPEIHYTENIIRAAASKEKYPVLKLQHSFSGKYILDILFASFFTVTVLSWLVPVLALLIKLNSKGPVFFLQKRNGKDGKLFTCIKFRTMRLNEEADLITAAENDERITGIGGFLRRHHLDELPQLFNVIAGEMSVVGPRPYMVAENVHFEKLLPQYTQRHLVKPGITGLAQSLGYFGSMHDIENARERFELDMEYVKTISPCTDAKILFRTLLLVFGIKFYPQTATPHVAEKIG